MSKKTSSEPSFEGLPKMDYISKSTDFDLGEVISFILTKLCVFGVLFKDFKLAVESFRPQNVHFLIGANDFSWLKFGDEDEQRKHATSKFYKEYNSAGRDENSAMAFLKKTFLNFKEDGRTVIKRRLVWKLICTFWVCIRDIRNYGKVRKNVGTFVGWNFDNWIEAVEELDGDDAELAEMIFDAKFIGETEKMRKICLFVDNRTVYEARKFPKFREWCEERTLPPEKPRKKVVKPTAPQRPHKTKKVVKPGSLKDKLTNTSDVSETASEVYSSMVFIKERAKKLKSKYDDLDGKLALAKKECETLEEKRDKVGEELEEMRKAFESFQSLMKLQKKF